ncbi:hypothetical protein PPYR_12724 [Photinus pyralis]|uniref:BAH domain-containing protein n=2 Tax=Photinus pyralis TaxID=7054 RepID=A0A5N4A6Z9_PHOPY|nr:hypothetical protein PPYR_12724 [Photinus pyralis]
MIFDDDNQVMLGSPAGPGGASQRGLWPLAPAPAPPISSFTTDGFGRYGVYSLFPGGPNLGGAIYSHASTIGRFSSGVPPTGAPFHATHKESLFSSTGYTFGAPTPPPGSPYSPVTATQLELFTKGFNSSNIIFHQPDVPLSPKKLDRKCEEKCYKVKSEKPCICQHSPTSKPKYAESSSGCSRTNPIDWSLVSVKKEPGSNPCQVAEITTSISPVVKIEVTSPTHKNTDISVAAMPSVVTTNGNIPVGIAVARQRVQHHDIVSSPSLPPAGLLTTVNSTTRMSRLSELDSTPGMAAGTTGGVSGGGAVLQCTEDRTSGLAAWSLSGSHNSTIATPTLWQYPAALPVEPMVPLPVPVPPVGVQLVRDPTSGHLLLLPTTGIEQVQQAVLWPSYHQPSSVLLPPIPPPPLQLLSSASSDYLSTSTTLHQHTQTHSTRLLAVTTTDAKRKIPLPIPATTLIKIETDATTLDQTKTLQAVSTIASNTGTVFTDQNMAPLVTTHVIYQHPTNLILSQAPTTEASCRSQATSPVVCLTPPPETAAVIEEEPPCVQDASNQTDIPICIEEDTVPQSAEIASEANHKEDKEEEKLQVPEQIPERCKPVETVDEPPCHNQEEEHKVPPQPDLSGLELLSNSIVEFENCLKNSEPKIDETNVTVKSEHNDAILQRIKEMSIKDKETESVILDDKLGGLDLLCALAEQRIMEEVEVKKIAPVYSRPKEKTRDLTREERKKEKRKAKRSHDEHRRKKLKKDSDCASESEVFSKDNDHRTYKSRQSEEEVRKFIASKSQSTYPKGDWPEMNALELDMRMKLADLQRQYREKQRELSKLKTKRRSLDEKDARKRKSRKKSTYSDRSATPPPLLDKMDVPPVKPNRNLDLLKPPTLCAVSNQVDLPGYRSHSSCDSSPEKTSSSKKRKVGRPKKLMTSCDLRTATETIVAKKPKAGSFVGYLLAAKQKLQMQTKDLVYSNSPPRYVEESTKKAKTHKVKNHLMVSPQVHSEKPSKIRPKLKAELTVKSYVEEEEANNEWEQPHEDIPKEEMEVKQIDQEEEVPEEVVPIVAEEPEVEAAPLPVEEKVKIADNRCVLTAEHLDKDKTRVLTAMGGLFYAGQLNSVEPPDVYSITLDGERGNRPHIMSREEILRDAIIEVSPANVEELAAGTRLCAYWSQQYRCLYPGSVAEPGTPDPELDSKFVAVEFDDGDSGRIAIDDIRLLPPNYPIIEYDPNPLLSLSKRRRRISATSGSVGERRLSQCLSSISSPPPVINEPIKAKTSDTEKENKDANKPETSAEEQRERKRLKKKKRDKLKQKLAHDDRKKKKKHKCTEENCKHKKHHKKHRRHKKHHHKEESETPTEPPAEIEVEKSPIEVSIEKEDEPEDEFNEDPEYQPIVNPEDEVTLDDILEAKSKKSKKIRDRQESCESRSKMTAFLPARQLWSWSGKGYRRPKAKGRSRKQFFKTIQRGKEAIVVGDSAVFLSTGRPDRPYIGRIEAMWEICGTMVVKVKWFYHPEETVGCPLNLKYPGALFESPHIDENDVQTISHKCEVLPLKDYREKLEDDPKRYATIYDNNDVYYLAGYYDPSAQSLKIQPDIPFNAD